MGCDYSNQNGLFVAHLCALSPASWLNCFTTSCCPATTSSSLPASLLSYATHLSLLPYGFSVATAWDFWDTYSAVLMLLWSGRRRVLTPCGKSGNFEAHSIQPIRGSPEYNIFISIDVFFLHMQHWISLEEYPRNENEWHCCFQEMKLVAKGQGWRENFNE